MANTLQSLSIYILIAKKAKIIKNKKKKYLNKTNFFGIATEALPATHQTILADDCVRVSANTTVQKKKKKVELNNKFNSVQIQKFIVWEIKKERKRNYHARDPGP